MRCSLELTRAQVRRRLGWLPRDAKLIFVRKPTEYGWRTDWSALLWEDGQFITVPVLSQAFLTSGVGNQTFTFATSASDWNDNNNKVECIGGGGSGNSNNTAGNTGGGGGGAYALISNFVHGTTATYQVGQGGTAVTNSQISNAGTVTYWNASADPGAGTDNTKCSAQPGGAAGHALGGVGGVGTSGWGQTRNSGGTGSAGSAANGGGGAGGPSGAGSLGTSSKGGNADNSVVTGPSTTGPGVSGTEFDGSHGCGTGAFTSTGTAQSGGLYGGGGTGVNPSTSASGAGAQGIIVLTWTPVIFFIGGFYETVIPRKTSLFIKDNFNAWPPLQEPTKVQPEGWAGVFPETKASWLKKHNQPVGVWPELQEPIQVQPEGWPSIFPTVTAKWIQSFNQPVGVWPELQEPTQVQPEGWPSIFPTVTARWLKPFNQPVGVWPELQEPTQVQPEGWPSIFPTVSARWLKPFNQPVGVWPELQAFTQPEGWPSIFPTVTAKWIQSFNQPVGVWPEIQEPTKVQPEGWPSIFPTVTAKWIQSFNQPVGVWPEIQEPTKVQPEGWPSIFPTVSARWLKPFNQPVGVWPELQEPTKVQPEGWAGTYDLPVHIPWFTKTEPFGFGFPYAAVVTYPDGWRSFDHIGRPTPGQRGAEFPGAPWPLQQVPTKVQPEGWAGVYPDQIPAKTVNAAIQFGADSWSPFVVPLPPPVTEVHFRYFFADVGSMMTR